MFNIFNTRWIVDCTYSKHGGNYYPKGPKSNSHRGDEVSNQYTQLEFIKKPTIAMVREYILKKYPKAANLRITNIIKY